MGREASRGQSGQYRPTPRGWVRGKGWGPWGEDDEIGALNGIGEVLVKHAVQRMVTVGKIYDLDPGRFSGMGVYPGHPPYTMVRFHTPLGWRVDLGVSMADTLEANPRGQSGMNEIVIGTQHTGAHVDGLCHVTVARYPGKPDDFDHGYFYNGFSVREHVGDTGAKRADIASMPPLVSKGLLLDVYGYFQARDKAEVLDRGYELTKADLEATLDWEGIDIDPGDSVLIRTGLMRFWQDWTKILECSLDSVGPGREGAEWLVLEKGAVFLASDTTGLEHHPAAPGQGPDPVHAFLLIEQGVHIGEFFWLEDLARDRAYEFLFVVSPLKLHGATGSMVRPIAIR